MASPAGGGGQMWVLDGRCNSIGCVASLMVNVGVGGTRGEWLAAIAARRSPVLYKEARREVGVAYDERPGVRTINTVDGLGNSGACSAGALTVPGGSRQ